MDTRGPRPKEACSEPAARAELRPGEKAQPMLHRVPQCFSQLAGEDRSPKPAGRPAVGLFCSGASKTLTPEALLEPERAALSRLCEHFTTGSPGEEVVAFPVIGGVGGSLKLGAQVTGEQPLRARPFGLVAPALAAGTAWPARTPPVFLLFRGTQWHVEGQGLPLKICFLASSTTQGAPLVIFHAGA